MRQSASDYNFMSEFSAILLKAVSLKTKKAAFTSSDFTSSIIHELKTPLNAIIGFAQLAKIDVKKNSDWKDNNSPSAENHSLDYINEIEKAATELSDLINDLLDVNSNSSQNFSIDLSKEIKISEVIARAVKLNYDFALRRKVKLTTEIDENIAKNLASVKLDEKRMKQILTNLISNSVKYSPEKTEVKISAKIIDKNNINDEVKNWKVTGKVQTQNIVGETKTQNIKNEIKNQNITDEAKAQKTQNGFVNSPAFLQIIVADQGFGMNEDEVKIAFEKYQTIPNPNSGIVDSFGLGLPIVKELTELQGGSITVESKPNLGTKMILNFPL